MILFAFFGFLQTTLAVGAGAVAIPVIIHLINRRRYKIVPWAAMRFLLAAQKQTRKRMRIEQLMLLLVRMMIMALIVFAMACVMPWAETIWSEWGLAQFGAGPQRKHRMHHILVLDASLSMNQMVGGQPAFEAVRQLAVKKIQDNPAGDGYSVLMLKDNPSWLIGEMSQDARKVAREIETVKAGHGNGSLSTALSMVSAKLTEARVRFPAQAVYFFTDMQRTGWMGAAPAGLKSETDAKEKIAYLEIQQKAATVFVDVGPLKDSDNLAVTNVAFDDRFQYVTAGTEITLKATVENFSTEAKANVRAELLIGKAKESPNDAPLQMRNHGEPVTKNIPARGSQVFAFDKVKFPSAGTYAVQVKIEGDALEADDSRTIVISVRDTIPVLLINGKPSGDRFDRATEYLRLSLNPFPPGQESKLFPLRPRVISRSQYLEMNAADLEAYDCIFWCDVGQFGANDVSRIDAHLRRGGGFVVALGANAESNLNDYNDLLYKDGQGLLPAKLLKKIQAPADHNFYFHTTAENFSLPPLNAFVDDADRLSLRTARFRQFVQSVVPEGKARTVLTFMPEVTNREKAKQDEKLPINAPALVEWNPPMSRAHLPEAIPGKKGSRGDRLPARYRGKVVLLTSTVNMDWTTWPGSPSYGAMMNEVTRLAVSGRLREQANTVGGLLEEYLPGGVEEDVTLHYPAHLADLKPARVHTQTIDEVNLFRWTDTDFSGIYRVRTKNDHEIPFAVNVPIAASDQKGTESDLARVDETKLRELYPGWNIRVVKDPLDAPVVTGPVDESAVEVPQPVGPKFANQALLAVLGLLFLEIVLAWRFGHYTATELVAPSPVSSFTSTMIAVVVAVLSTIVFALGAYVLIDEKFSGDFLGFLPDILRSSVEKALSVEPPMPGEKPNWRLEKMAFLFGLPAENWWAIGISIAALATIIFTYLAEAPKVSRTYKLLLGLLRLYMILLTLWFLLPRVELHFERRGWPDMAMIIDDSLSMGEQDAYQDQVIRERAKKLGDQLREKLLQQIPNRIQVLEAEIAAKSPQAEKDIDVKTEVDALVQRLHYWQTQQDQIAANKWRPSRLQLVQALLAQPEPNWLKALMTEHETKVHVFHLDVNGRATKLRDPLGGDAGEIVDPTDPSQINRAAEAIAQLEPISNESRLGTALRQVIDHYRGSSLSSIIMFTDGVTTRDETIAQMYEYAAQRGIKLFFIGLGDEQQLRDLKLHDLQVDDTIYVGDGAVFEVRLTGQGYKDLTVPVVLKYRDKNGKEHEVTGKGLIGRELVKVDPGGKSVKIRLRDQPKEVGSKKYIIEVEPPKLESNEKPIPSANLRLERTIEVIDTKRIKVLYVEGQPRYEFRFIKFLLEREAADTKKNKSIELKVLLLDGDDDFALQDKTALSNFPATLDELNQYDVVILGDCDPNHKKLQNRLKDIANFVRGEDEKGRKSTKPGGGLLFIGGSFNNPHRYKGTPLADVMPVEPMQDQAPADGSRTDRLRPELTAAGRMHPIFRFSPDEGESVAIWQRLTPMYWYSSKYRIKPLAEVLAVHPSEKAEYKDANQDVHGRHPLIVQQFVGTGRSMFFGFDETWRWRLREDESKFNNFWIQTMRYLSRGRSTRTDLRLDRQTPYRLGEKIKVTVRFPDNTPGGPNQGPKLNEKTEVKVTVAYLPPDAKDNARESELHTIQLAKVEGSWGTYEGTWDRTREGKYRFRLIHPDVSATQPDGEKPSAEAIVELPPGELDRLRMNYQEMMQAADGTQGEFFTLASADQVLSKLPPGDPVRVSPQTPPQLLWNQWWVFAFVVFLMTSEWILRKLKHLL